MQQISAAMAIRMLLLAASAGSVSARQLVQQSGGAEPTPVQRVVDLLRDLSKTVEKEGETELGLYEKFMCWGQSIISTKEASNEEASSRIDTLNTYLGDLDAGRVQFTSEGADLEKDIAELSADIELAAETRAKEEADYAAAKDEMDQAIKALTAAIEVLSTATKDHKDGVLLTLRGRLSQGSAAGASGTAAMTHAVELGNKFLSKGDALFMRRLLTGDVPTTDWKKLNRPANFKKSYKARSFKIQDVLAKLLETFTTNLADATKKETKAKNAFETLTTSKKEEKEAAQQALIKMEKEGGARSLSKTEATDELNKLTDQVDNDKKYIGQVKQTLADKKSEWKTRKANRIEELEAISKALAILNSGEARAQFRKSFKSQGFSLLQMSQGVRAQARRQDSRGAAAKHLSSLASRAQDQRLAVLAARLSSGGHFDEVLTAIDTMIETLEGEEAADLETKETCEQDRAADTREAKVASRDIDEMTDEIERLLTKISDLDAEIAESEKRVSEIGKELEEAKEIRDDQNADFKVAEKEDEEAVEVVEKTLGVLKAYYEKEGGESLTQTRTGRSQSSKPGAGDAPPPPPSTWDGDYKKKKGESIGVIACLTMIKEDIEKDMRTASNEEAESLAAYEKSKGALEGERSKLNTLIDSLNEAKGAKEQTVQDTKGERRLKKESLDATMKKIADADPGCTFFTVNFPTRLKNRQIEMDGLLKAKQILSGAVFTEPEERELKPGDAFLQHSKMHQG